MLYASRMNRVIVIVCCTCFPLPFVFSQELRGESAAKAKSEGQGWVLESQQLIRELEALVHQTQETDNRSWRMEEVPSTYRMADRLLWRLWLTTGRPPLIEKQGEALDIHLQRNVLAYQEYVAKHNSVTLEEINRLGLENAAESFGSPLWYMTIKYLAEKACFKTEGLLVVNTTPSRFMVVCPGNSEACSRQSAAFSRWMTLNRERMTWNPDTKRFHPRDGGYIGTDDLMAVLPPPFSLHHEGRKERIPGR